MKYVLGFIFNEELDKVILIKKKRPQWQEGLLNGIGGKIEKGEHPVLAMIRECKEECNLHIKNWVSIVDVTFESGDILHVYTAVHDISKAETMTDEEVSTYSIDYDFFNKNSIASVPTFIHECLEYHKGR